MFTGLTKQEQRILLGLIIVIIIALGIQYARKHREKDVIYIDSEKTASAWSKDQQGLAKESSEKYPSQAGWSRLTPGTAQKSTTAQADHSGMIDLNTASIEDLTILPGIGPARAEAIINYRDSVGGFRSLEQVKKAPTIGDKTYELLKTKFYVAPPTAVQETRSPALVQLSSSTQLTPTPELRININTATKEELCKLEGISDKIASRIIEYRQKYGGFKRPEDIMNVDGIGEKKFLQNKHRITVR